MTTCKLSCIIQEILDIKARWFCWCLGRSPLFSAPEAAETPTGRGEKQALRLMLVQRIFLMYTTFFSFLSQIFAFPKLVWYPKRYSASKEALQCMVIYRGPSNKLQTLVMNFILNILINGGIIRIILLLDNLWASQQARAYNIPLEGMKCFCQKEQSFRGFLTFLS